MLESIHGNVRVYSQIIHDVKEQPSGIDESIFHRDQVRNVRIRWHSFSS